MGRLSGNRCTIDDDLNVLREEMVEADGLILSAPTYGLTINILENREESMKGVYEYLVARGQI